NSVVLAVYLLFSVACFLTVHEHWHRGCPSRSPPANSPRPTRQGQRQEQQRGSAKCRWQKKRTAYSLHFSGEYPDMKKAAHTGGACRTLGQFVPKCYLYKGVQVIEIVIVEDVLV